MIMNDPEDKKYDRPPVIETVDGIDFGDEDVDYSELNSDETKEEFLRK